MMAVEVQIWQMREALHAMGYRWEYLEKVSDERIRDIYYSEYES